MRRSTRAIGAAISLIAVVALAGCGSDESASKGGTSDGRVQGDRVRLGFICSCSGPQAALLARTRDVAEAWAKDFNARGGVNGTPVDLVIKDDGGDPAKALQAAKELVEGDKVIAIVGATSVADAAFADYVTAKGVPVVGGASPEPVMGTNPNFYPSGSTLLALIAGTLSRAEGKEKLGAMYCAESPVCAQLVPLAEGVGSMFGLSVAAVKIAGTAPNYTAPCLAMEDEGADALFVASAGPVVQAVIGDCKQQGYEPTNVVQASTTTNTMLKDPNLEGSLIASTNANPYDVSLPAVKEFQDAVEKHSPGLIESDDFSFDGIYPWVGGKLFEAVVQAGGLTKDATSADVKTGLYALKDETLGGLTPPLTFTEGKPFFTACWFTAKVGGGTFVSENDNKATCLSADETAALVKAVGG